MSAEEPSHDLLAFLQSAQRGLQEEYVRIRQRASDDPGTAGDQGEENWATLFRLWLPSYFRVVTKGRVLGVSGVASPQIDVLVLRPSYPPVLLDKKLYLASGVAAAFECKTTLIASHVHAATKSGAAVKKLTPRKIGRPRSELQSDVYYGLLAHSHSWKTQGSTPLDNVESNLWSAHDELVDHPYYAIDSICVSDLSSWTSITNVRTRPENRGLSDAITDVCVSKGYIRYAIADEQVFQAALFSPIGALLVHLYGALAWQYPEMRELETYFRSVNAGGAGHGQTRLWPGTVLSDLVRKEIIAGRLSRTTYDEWSGWVLG